MIIVVHSYPLSNIVILQRTIGETGKFPVMNSFSFGRVQHPPNLSVLDFDGY